jgi:hypothetical protein
MYRKFTLMIAFSAALLLLIVFSLTPHAAQATSRHARQGKSKIGSPSGITIVLESAASRKRHGETLGSDRVFDIDMPLGAGLNDGNSGIECRAGGDRNGGGAGDYLIVLTFNTAVTEADSVSVTAHNPATAGGSAGTPTFDSTEMSVPLSGVTNEQVLTLSVTNVSDGTNPPISFDVNIGFLIGDTTDTRTVNASDISQTKASGAAVDSTNFRNDITHNDAINSSDISAAKAASGTAAP